MAKVRLFVIQDGFLGQAGTINLRKAEMCKIFNRAQAITLAVDGAF